MVFSSAVFLFYFLPVVFILYLLCKRSIYLQNIVLFFSSLVFYFWGEKEFSILVLISIMINYGFGLLIDRQREEAQKRLVLFAGILINLSMLLYFKYYNFFINDIVCALTDAAPLKPNEKVHLPLGISFFTFHGLTYITDIYRREANVSHNPLNLGLYILFFPQLIAGPIVRYKDIDRQLTARELNNEKLMLGVRRFIIGLAKKMLIANTLGKVADDIFILAPYHLSFGLSWLATLCYTLQIYYDFSGYSDMAIGLARIFGFEFLENFNFPYAASSIRDFWRRWHISLSTFFRDYVYKPLGGSKGSQLLTYRNLLLVFFVTGLWHGASWNFIIWGLFHGLFLLIERLGFERGLQKLPVWVRHVYTMLVVMVGWVFFRTENLDEALIILQKMAGFLPEYTGTYSIAYFMHISTWITLFAGILLVFPLHRIVLPDIHLRPGILYDLVCLGLFVLSLLFLSASSYNPFIYYRF